LLFFLRLSQCFPAISGFSIDIHIRKHYHFSTSFLPLWWPVDLIQLNFCPLAQPLVPPLVVKYAENAVGLFTLQGARQFGINDLVTAKFSEHVKKSMSGSVLNKLAQCCLISCPRDCRTRCQGKP